MTRAQRRLHTLAWLVLGPALLLVVLAAVERRAASWDLLREPAPTTEPR